MKLAFSLFCKNMLLNLLIAAQICASVLFGMISVAVIKKAYIYYDLSRTIDSAYLYIAKDEDIYHEDSMIVKYVSSGDIILSRTRSESIWACDSSIQNAAQYNMTDYSFNAVYSFGPLVSTLMSSQLKKGSWFSDEAKDGVIECVIIGDEKDFPIGTVLDGALISLIANDDLGYNLSILSRLNSKLWVLADKARNALPLFPSRTLPTATK